MLAGLGRGQMLSDSTHLFDELLNKYSLKAHTRINEAMEFSTCDFFKGNNVARIEGSQK